MKINQAAGAVGSYFKRRYLLAVWSVLIVLLSELFSRNEAKGLLDWGIHNLSGVLFNIVLVFGLLLLFSALFGRARAAFWVVTILTFALSMISGIKLKMLGVPLLPWDFVLTGEGADMAQYLKNILSATLAAGLIVFVIISILLLYRTSHAPKKIGWGERGAFGAVAILLLALLYFDKPPVEKWFGLTPINYDQSVNVKTNGFLLATVMNVKQMAVAKPVGYDKNAITAIATLPSPTAASASQSGVKPNIIVILSESFFDATKIEGIKFARDPLPFYHQLQKETTSGEFLSPQFGGGTANVEFEVLTGNSMRFLPQGSIPYNQYINKGIDSIASILARQNYKTTAISPFYNWFFNANKVYEDFGFGKFIPLEYFDPNYVGPYIADSEVTKNIIRTTSESKEPDMVFANTMENHFHYWPGKFKENTIKVSGVSGNAKGFFETYAQGLIDVDKMLQDLVAYYSKSSEPTIILFFGDHLPVLGDEYEAYKASHYISGEDDPDFLDKMYRTPFLVWNNYLPKEKVEHNLYMSPSFASPYLLNLAGLSGSYYTDFLAKQAKKTPVIPPKNYFDKMGIKEDDLKTYETLQYDILFGDQHGYADAGIKDHILVPGYHLGYGPIHIDSVSPENLKAGESEGKITVSGSYLPLQSKLFLNDKELETTIEQDGRLTGKVPQELLKSGTATLKAKLTDSKGTVVGESNEMSITIE